LENPHSEEDDDLLELTTDETPVEEDIRAAAENAMPELSDTFDHDLDGTTTAPAGTVFRIEPPLPKDNGERWDSPGSVDSNFSIFGTSGLGTTVGANNYVAKVLPAIALVALGAVLGIATYYLMSPRPVDTDGPRLTEMRAANIPLSAFEENRRNVDKDPTNYIARFGADPQDCEDYYLLSRAYLLTGDYANAKNALTQARQRLSEADPSNAAVLASDIAIAMSVVNGTTVQSMLKKELEAAKGLNSTSISNSNSNR
jgi:hypothetical protein